MSENQERNPDREHNEEGIFPDDVSPDAVPDDTVLMGDEEEEETKPKSKVSGPAETGELGPGLDPRSMPRKTEEVPQQFRDSAGADMFAGVGGTGALETEGMTEGLPTEGFAGGGSGDSEESSGIQTGEEDPDEVLVLLDDETGEVGGTESLGTEAMEGAGGFTRELGLSTESIEEIGLKSINPLHAGSVPDVDTPDMGDFEESDEPVGVINEIMELATSLDPDILGAGDGDDDDDGYYEDEYREFREPVAADAPRSRGKTFVVLGSLAAVAAVGFFMFSEIKDWYETNFKGVETTATAGGGGTDSGPDEPPDVTGTALGTAPQPDEPEVSRTRIAVRDRIQFAVQLGLQWEEREE